MLNQDLAASFRLGAVDVALLIVANFQVVSAVIISLLSCSIDASDLAISGVLIQHHAQRILLITLSLNIGILSQDLASRYCAWALAHFTFVGVFDGCKSLQNGREFHFVNFSFSIPAKEMNKVFAYCRRNIYILRERDVVCSGAPTGLTS